MKRYSISSSAPGRLRGKYFENSQANRNNGDKNSRVRSNDRKSRRKINKVWNFFYK